MDKQNHEPEQIRFYKIYPPPLKLSEKNEQ